MATVIDHILVELQLDPKKFDESIKKSAEAWMKLRQQAEQSHKDTREPVDAMSKAFGALTVKILAFAASLITLQKIAQFTKNIVNSNISLGNLSTTTGIAIEKLSAWANMAARHGSSVESMTQAIAGMDSELKEMQVTGGLSGNLATMINSLNQLNANIETPSKTTTAIEMWERILEGLDRTGMTAREKSAFLEKFGYADTSVTALFARHSAQQIAEMVDKQKDIYVVTQQNVDESLMLAKQWGELAQRAENLGRILLHDLANPIGAALDAANAVFGGKGVPQHGADTGHDTFETMRRPHEGSVTSPGGYLQAPQTGMDWTRKTVPMPGERFPAPPSRPPQAPHPDDVPEIPQKATPNQFSGGASATFRGAASFYSGLPSEGGSRTSTGERVDPASYTGALQSGLAKQYGGLRKGGVWADVTDERTGKKVRVYLNDTGPLRPGRVVDLSPKAFGEFGPLSKGVHQNMRVDILPPAPRGKSYRGGPVGEDDNPFQHGAPPLPWLSNPRLLRAPRFNQMLNPTQNYATSEMNVHSLIVNSADKPVTDDAYGLSNNAIPTLERGNFMSQMTEGPF